MGKGGKGKGENGQRSKSSSDWICPISTCAYVNFAYRTRCRLCEAHPSERRPPPQEAGVRGGKGGGASPGAKPTLAERQLEAARAQQKQQQLEVTALRKEKAALERKLASAAKEAAAAPSGGDDEEDDDEMDASENVEQELEKLVRRRKDLSDGGWEDDEELPKQLDEQIKSLRKRRDEAKPQHVRLVKVDRRIAKCQKRVDGHKKELQDVQSRIDELVVERDDKKGLLDAAIKELEEAKEERSAEYQRALDEEKEERKQGMGQKASTESPTKVAFEAIKADARANLEGTPLHLVAEIDGTLSKLESLLASVPRKVFAATGGGAAETPSWRRQSNERTPKGKGGAAAASSGAAGNPTNKSGGTGKEDVGLLKGETGEQAKGTTAGQKGGGGPSPADPVPNVLAPNGQLPKPADGNPEPVAGKGEGQSAGSGNYGAAGGAAVGSDNDEELVEDNGTSADVDMDKPINGLPSRQRDMVLAMLRECRAQSPEGAKPRDRERSPRRVDESAV